MSANQEKTFELTIDDEIGNASGSEISEHEPEYVIHKINHSTDNLTSLAIAYGTTKPVIMRANQMMSDDLDLFPHQELIIPLTPNINITRARNNLKLSDADKNRALVAAFKRSAPDTYAHCPTQDLCVGVVCVRCSCWKHTYFREGTVTLAQLQ